jgi:sec-independent protein translocase protein TatC
VNENRAPTDAADDVGDPDDADGMADSRQKPMGFLDHLEELRWTLVKCAVAFAIAAGVIGYFLKNFNDVLLWPLRHVQAENADMKVELATRTVMESFGIVIQLCGFGGLALAAPFMVVFAGQFVAPALTEKEMKLVIPTGFSAFVLFALGAAFGFFLLVPSTLRVSLGINQLLGFAPPLWTPDSYYSLLTWLVLGVGAAFEFPLLIVMAVHFGFLRVETLRKYRRHAIVGIFLIAAVVTPTPDPFTQCLFAAPLYVLFELAIIVGARVQARREARLTAEGQ